MKARTNALSRLFLVLLLVLSSVFSLFGGYIQILLGTDSPSSKLKSDQTIYTGFGFQASDGAEQTAASGTSFKGVTLIPGGMAFGVKFNTRGVMVVGFDDMDEQGEKTNPAYDAGIRTKDIITKINGSAILSASQLTEAVESSGGGSITLTYTRSGKEYTATIKPKYSNADGRYKTGLWVRDSGAGIGTVTYINPRDLTFGGLGHGICDSETGALIPMDRGVVMGVTIGGVEKGVAGAPGEIKGYFSKDKVGALYSNTSCGVFGALSQLPSDLKEREMPIATKNEVKEGDAYIWCTLDDTGAHKYTIKISEINRSATGNKCFTVTVTDPALIEKTGGIVQGMSGSPIIQDGKLVGAVTHVLINDPSTGYGIFIENMLSASAARNELPSAA